MNLQAVRGTAAGIARQAGAEILRHLDQPHLESTKKSVFDIVTDADQQSEAVIVAALQATFPDHHIVGEEGGGMGAPADNAEYFWYIDPIDGTSNFANNIPFFSVSIALADRDLNPLVGVVYNPVSNELFSAARGMGATRNGEQIHVSTTADLEQAILCTGFPYDATTRQRTNVETFVAILNQTRGVCRFGSAALEMCFVACGRFEGFWEATLNPWDCMAGILITREAGGRVSDYSGKETGLTGTELLATNGLLHAALLAEIQAYGGR